MTHFFRPVWVRRGLQCLTVVSLLLSQACSDDDGNGTDKTAPQISFANLADGQTVRNTVKASLTALDDKGIQKVDIYVDGTLLTSLTAVPFDITWDTNTATDGQHIIKAVATDANGNTAEKSITVSVSNVLVTLDIAIDELAQDGEKPQRGFVFLSDANGKLLAATEYTNGQKKDLKAPGFDGDNFFLTEVRVQTEDGEDEVALSTYASIERGKTWYIATDLSEDFDDDVVGNATLNFTNLPKDGQFEITSGSFYAKGSGVYINELVTSPVNIALRKSPTTLYVRRTSPGPYTYSLIPDVAVGSTLTLDLSKVNKPMTTAQVDLPDYAESINYGILGYPRANDYTEGYNVFSAGMGNNGGDVFQYYYPGTAFPSYTSELEVKGNGFIVYRQNASTEFNAEKPDAAATFAFASNKLTVSTTGTSSMDVVAIPFEDETTLWYYFLSPGQNQAIPTLELPDLLNNWSFPGLDQPISYELYDFDKIGNYNELNTYLRSGKSSFNRLFDRGRTYLEVDYRNDLIGRESNRASHYSSLAIQRRK